MCGKTYQDSENVTTEFMLVNLNKKAYVKNLPKPEIEGATSY